jgi:hypothetical protein
MESRLIQVMIYKMLPIQFVSSVNLIQLWSIKVIHNVKNISSPESRHAWSQFLSVHRVQRYWLSHFSRQLDVHRIVSDVRHQFLVAIRETKLQHESEVARNRCDWSLILLTKSDLRAVTQNCEKNLTHFMLGENLDFQKPRNTKSLVQNIKQ